MSMKIGFALCGMVVLVVIVGYFVYAYQSSPYVAVSDAAHAEEILEAFFEEAEESGYPLLQIAPLNTSAQFSIAVMGEGYHLWARNSSRTPVIDFPSLTVELEAVGLERDATTAIPDAEFYSCEDCDLSAADMAAIIQQVFVKQNDLPWFYELYGFRLGDKSEIEVKRNWIQTAIWDLTP